MTFREIWSSGINVSVTLWLVVLLIMAFVIRAAYYRVYRADSSRHLWWLRFAAVALVLIALADLTRQRFQVQLPDLVIAIDDSRSSSFPNQMTDSTHPVEARIDFVKSVLTSERVAELSRRFRLRFWKLGETSTPFSEDVAAWREQLQANQPASRLGTGILRILEHQQGKQTAGVMVFSDGAVTGGSSLAEAGIAAGQQTIPMFVVGVGSPLSPPNLSLDNLRANRRVRVNEPTTITVDVVADTMNDATCQVDVTDAQTGEQLTRQEIVIGSDQFRRSISLGFVNQQPGPRTVVVTASASVNEADTSDNQVTHSIEVVEGRTRILIVQDYPGPWYRLLKENLSRAVDPETGENAFEVHTLLQQASANFDRIDTTAQDNLPVDKLADYDVIVLGDARLDEIGKQRGLTDDQCIALGEYVRSLSGNLIFVPGSRHLASLASQESLATLLPFGELQMPESISDKTYRLEVLTAAEGLAAMRGFQAQGQLPTPGEFHIFPIPAEGAAFTTIAEFFATDSQERFPAITLQRIGSGSVITHFSDELYRMRYRADADLWAQYWIRMVTELAAERLQKRDVLAVVDTDASTYTTNQVINISADIFDPLVDLPNTPSIDIQMVTRQNETRSLELNQAVPGASRYQGSTGPLTPGDYRLVLATPGYDSEFAETRFTVAAGKSESSIVNQQREALVQLATQSSGFYVDSQDVDQLWSQLPRGNWNQVGAASYDPIWSWPWIPPLFALLVIGLLAVEWVMRRKLRLD